MSNRIKSKKIKDCTYTISVLDGVSALEGFGTLAKYAGGPIGMLLASGASGEDPQLLAAALRELGTALGSSDMRELAFRLLEGSTVCAEGGKPMPLIKGGNKELFAGHFAGKIGEILQLVWFALSENYANFSEALPNIGELSKRLQSLGQNSQDPTTGASSG